MRLPPSVAATMIIAFHGPEATKSASYSWHSIRWPIRSLTGPMRSKAMRPSIRDYRQRWQRRIAWTTLLLSSRPEAELAAKFFQVFFQLQGLGPVELDVLVVGIDGQDLVPGRDGAVQILMLKRHQAVLVIAVRHFLRCL